MLRWGDPVAAERPNLNEIETFGFLAWLPNPGEAEIHKSIIGTGCKFNISMHTISGGIGQTLGFRRDSSTSFS